MDAGSMPGVRRGVSKKEALMFGVLVAVVIVIIVLVRRNRSARAGAPSQFTSGPYNIQLYDYPYYYPFYTGRNATDWDGDKHCVSYCSQEPCAVWCR